MARPEITGRKPAFEPDRVKQLQNACRTILRREPTLRKDNDALVERLRSYLNDNERSVKSNVLLRRIIRPVLRKLQGVAREAFTIQEFCAAYRISEDMFHKMRRAGWAPAVMKVGTKVLISIAAAEQWRRDREAAGTRDLAVD
jgi:hypothetical protein